MLPPDALVIEQVRLKEQENYDWMIKTIERGEARISSKDEIAKGIGKKLNRYNNPWLELKIHYGQNKEILYNDDCDRFTMRLYFYSHLLLLCNPAEIRTESASLAEEAKADAIAAAINWQDVPNRETPLHLTVKFGDQTVTKVFASDEKYKGMKSKNKEAPSSYDADSSGLLKLEALNVDKGDNVLDMISSLPLWLELKIQYGQKTQNKLNLHYEDCDRFMFGTLPKNVPMLSFQNLNLQYLTEDKRDSASNLSLMDVSSPPLGRKDIIREVAFVGGVPHGGGIDAPHGRGARGGRGVDGPSGRRVGGRSGGGAGTRRPGRGGRGRGGRNRGARRPVYEVGVYRHPTGELLGMVDLYDYRGSVSHLQYHIRHLNGVQEDDQMLIISDEPLFPYRFYTPTAAIAFGWQELISSVVQISVLRDSPGYVSVYL